MVDQRKVRRILRKQLLTVEGLPDRPQLAWENRAFKPPSIDPGKDPSELMWIRETILPVSERTLNPTGTELIAIAQYDIFVPSGSGTQLAEDLATAIGKGFEPPLGLVGEDNDEPVTMSIYRTERKSGATDGAWWFVPVQVFLRAYEV